jgi:hypothetical protein
MGGIVAALIRGGKQPGSPGGLSANQAGGGALSDSTATATAIASARGQRVAILASTLHELTGFYLALDCLVVPHAQADATGQRIRAILELATPLTSG